MGHMGAVMGHAYAHTWPYMGAYIGHIGAAMGHACAHTWAIYRVSPTPEGRKGTAGNPFPSLDQGRELPRAYPFPIPQRNITSIYNNILYKRLLYNLRKRRINSIIIE